jgi:HSP20 family protein
MFPFGKDKGIRKPTMLGGFDELFADFDAYAEQMLNAAQTEGGRSFVYGYRSYTGADGKPIVEEFSNSPGFNSRLGGRHAALPTAQQSHPGCSCAAPEAETGAQAIEPYHDVLSEGGEIKVIVEMPGVDREQITVQSHGRYVTVKAESEHKKYETDIRVPDAVESKPQKAQYKNGVLEITYRKSDEPTDVEVE